MPALRVRRFAPDELGAASGRGQISPGEGSGLVGRSVRDPAWSRGYRRSRAVRRSSPRCCARRDRLHAPRRLHEVLRRDLPDVPRCERITSSALSPARAAIPPGSRSCSTRSPSRHDRDWPTSRPFAARYDSTSTTPGGRGRQFRAARGRRAAPAARPLSHHGQRQPAATREAPDDRGSANGTPGALVMRDSTRERDCRRRRARRLARCGELRRRRCASAPAPPRVVLT